VPYDQREDLYMDEQLVLRPNGIYNQAIEDAIKAASKYLGPLHKAIIEIKKLIKP
jgi:hypothetical protein